MEANTPPDKYPIPMRMSSAGKCPRAIAYRSLGYDETDPPDRAAETRLEVGHTAEAMLVKHTREDGWTIDHADTDEGGQLEIQHWELPLTGHPDGICSHPEFTKGLPVTLEAKSMYNHRLEQVMELGIFEAYPDYKAQVACYSAVLYRMGLVAHPYRAVFICMDRDGNEMPPERCAWEPEYTQQLFAKLRQTWAMIQDTTLPDRPYQPGDPHCRYCNFHTTCHGSPKPVDTPEEPVWISPNEDTEIARQYHQGVKQRLEALSVANNHADIKAGPLTAGFFTPRNDVYDEGKLRKFLTAEQLRQCRTIPQPRFWIRAR